MVYSAVKALHIYAMVLWMGGTLAAGLLLLWARRADAVDARAVGFMRRWDRRVTTPSMVVVWIIGLWMAHDAGLWSAGWLQLKLVFVVLLSAVHGIVTGGLRRLVASGKTALSARSAAVVPVTLVLLPVILLLAVVKPF